jgi:hypothetical protein
MAILTDIAPSWAKAVATVAAPKNGKNMGTPFRLIRDKEKRPRIAPRALCAQNMGTCVLFLANLEGLWLIQATVRDCRLNAVGRWKRR